MSWTVPSGYRVAPPVINIAREALDRQIALGCGARAAIVAETARWSYDDLARAVEGCAAGLAAQGVAKGSMVLFRSRNTPQYCAAVIAAFKLGAVPVFTNSALTAAEINHILATTEARFAVTQSALAAPLRDFARAGRLSQIVLLDGTPTEPNETAYAALRTLSRIAPATAETAAEDPAFLFFSSGTTGAPKGILHAQRWIVTVGDVIRLQMEYRANDVVMTPGEFSFMATFGHCFMAPLLSGATIALYDGRPAPAEVLGAIVRDGVNKFMSIPTFYRTVLATPGVESDLDLARVVIWVSGGEALGATPQAAWQDRFGKPLYDMYGITEMEVMIANGPAIGPKPGSLGRALPGIKLALLDDELVEVAPGEPGTLMVHRSDPGLFLGYYKQWDKWQLAHKGEWYDTGDVMTCDAQGYFWYQGRTDDLFKTRGMTLSPQEVEDALMRHPAVAEAAVVGLPDPRTGNAVVAFIVRRADAPPVGPALAREIMETARLYLAAYKVPERIEFVAALPKSPVGKIVRRALREGANRESKP